MKTLNELIEAGAIRAAEITKKLEAFPEGDEAPTAEEQAELDGLHAEAEALAGQMKAWKASEKALVQMRAAGSDDGDAPTRAGPGLEPLGDARGEVGRGAGGSSRCQPPPAVLGRRHRRQRWRRRRLGGWRQQPASPGPGRGWWRERSSSGACVSLVNWVTSRAEDGCWFW